MGIKIENIVTPSPEQWMAVIRAMRNPLNSWRMSDSDIITEGNVREFQIGENDLALMKRLAKAGSDHRKFTRMLPVWMDVTGPTYWLLQLDTYKVGTVSSSTSKMHKLMAKPFTIADFSFENHFVTREEYQDAIDGFNEIRDKYLMCEDSGIKREIWQSLLDILPESYNQMRTMFMNYEVLYSMYMARKDHKLVFWHDFCETIVCEIPYFAEIFGIES